MNVLIYQITSAIKRINKLIPKASYNFTITVDNSNTKGYTEITNVARRNITIGFIVSMLFVFYCIYYYLH